jgi:hypothetical protein
MSTLNRRSSVGLGAVLLSAASAAVQSQTCVPGAAFGITAYRCASCGAATYRDSTHTVYTFGAEPVVMEATTGNRIRAGDVVVAVNGNPITTRAGADQFTYPPAGESLVTVRRNGMNVEISQQVTTQLCNMRGVVVPQGMSGRFVGPDSVLRMSGVAAGASGGGGGGGGGRGGRGGARVGGGAGGRGTTDSIARLYPCLTAPVTRPSPSGRGDSVSVKFSVECPADSLRARMSSAQRLNDSARSALALAQKGGFAGSMGSVATAPESQSSFVDLKNFGILLSCRPSCTRARARDGTIYWKFDGYPAVGPQGSVKEGVAVKAGLHEGDVIIAINGLSPLTEEGALLLNRTDRELTINLEVSRGGKREKFTLKL